MAERVHGQVGAETCCLSWSNGPLEVPSADVINEYPASQLESTNVSASLARLHCPGIRSSSPGVTLHVWFAILSAQEESSGQTAPTGQAMHCRSSVVATV
eukprot:1438142-Rhodomonas_salina.1